MQAESREGFFAKVSKEELKVVASNRSDGIGCEDNWSSSCFQSKMVAQDLCDNPDIRWMIFSLNRGRIRYIPQNIKQGTSLLQTSTGKWDSWYQAANGKRNLILKEDLFQKMTGFSTTPNSFLTHVKFFGHVSNSRHYILIVFLFTPGSETPLSSSHF